MGDVARAGRTILFVSHNMAAINNLCTRAILLERGILDLDGSPDDVTAAYLARSRQSGTTDGEGAFEPLEGKGVSLSGMEIVMRPGTADTGSDLEITLDCSLVKRVNPFGVGVEIRTSQDVLIGRYSPSVTGLVENVGQGERRFRVTFPGIDRYLANGEYWVRIWLAHQRMEILLDVPNAGRFQVDDPVGYNSGKEFVLESQGIVKLPVEFKTL
jgi:lipopolysaccharide transport system ATP-binding protein